ncbi:hypothetical protein OHAE_3424 [Ochrobactrum soli]|uniref:Uncharacterized protein n=1 Tax=Ochrobactrum soli TaxID=2448455 RepID=A0A2P9HHB0_9HYPH|nr:hypothetical protein OHAE_3424 [[Ochrobactrum] soli]
MVLTHSSMLRKKIARMTAETFHIKSYIKHGNTLISLTS